MYFGFLNGFYLFILLLPGAYDEQDAPDGPDSRAEEEAGEDAGTRREGRRSGGYHHRYVNATLPGGDTWGYYNIAHAGCLIFKCGGNSTFLSVSLSLLCLQI